MDQLEIVKVIINGGSFALIAVGVVWMLFYGVPAIQKAFTVVEEKHAATIASIEAQHTASLAQHRAECREERREAESRFRAEREGDRAADRQQKMEVIDKFKDSLARIESHYFRTPT